MPAPFSLANLQQALSAELIVPPEAWPAIIQAHQSAMEQQLELRNGQIEGLMVRELSGTESVNERTQMMLDRFKLSQRQFDIEAELLNQVGEILGDSAAPAMEAVRRTRQRRSLMQLCSGYMMRMNTDVVDVFQDLALKPEERLALGETVRAIEANLLAILRQMEAAIVGTAATLKVALAEEGLTGDFMAGSEALTKEEQKELRAQVARAREEAVAPMIKIGNRLIEIQRQALKDLVALLPPRPALQLQRSFYQHFYEAIGEVFPSELERVVRVALRRSDITPAEAAALRTEYDVWVQRETAAAVAAAASYDESRHDRGLYYADIGPSSDAQRRIQYEMQTERAESLARSIASVNAILGPSRAPASSRRTRTPPVPVEGDQLGGLMEMDQPQDKGVVVDYTRTEPGSWSQLRLRQEDSPAILPEVQELLLNFLAAEPDQRPAMELLLRDFMTSQLARSEAMLRVWQDLHGVPDASGRMRRLGGADGRHAPSDEVLEQLRQLRGADWDAQDRLWEDMAALLPPEQCWRADLVRLARHCCVEIPVTSNRPMQQLSGLPDLAAVALLGVASDEQLAAYTRALLAAEADLTAAATRCEETSDQLIVNALLSRYRTIPEPDQQACADKEQETGPSRQELQRRSIVEHDARRQALLRAGAAAITAATAGADELSAQLLQALTRSAESRIWEVANSPGRFINTAIAVEALAAANGDAMAKADLLRSQLEPIRQSWQADWERCCQQMTELVLAEMAHVLNPPGPEVPHSWRPGMLRSQKVTRDRFFRDETNLRAMERIALVLGEERMSRLPGFAAEREKFFRRSAELPDH